MSRENGVSFIALEWGKFLKSRTETAFLISVQNHRVYKERQRLTLGSQEVLI